MPVYRMPIAVKRNAVLIGGDVKDLYKIKDNGNFADPRARASFEETMASAPARLSFAFNLKSSQMQGEAMEVIYEKISGTDLRQMSKLAKTPEEVTALKNLVTEIHTMAAAKAAAPGAGKAIALARQRQMRTMRS